MRKIFSIFFIYFLIFSFDIFAQKFRNTSFDDRPACEDSKGVWRQFGNGCADECRAKFDEFSICTQAITNACECGKNRCWNGEACVSLKEYKKIYDKQQIEEQKILDAAKEKRKEMAKENAQAIMIKLTTVTDPNNPNNVDKKTDQQPAVSAVSQQTVSTAQAIPTAQAVPLQQSAIAENPQVPPLFLQQEQAKQNATVSNAGNSADSQKNKTSGGFINSSIPPGLPEIPLPN